MNESQIEQVAAPGSLTLLLHQVSKLEGAEEADKVEQLYARIEAQFRRMANQLLSGHRAARSPAITEVVDEVFMNLIVRNKLTWDNRRQFLGMAAVSMRRWIANHYRSQNTEKQRIDRDALPLSGDVLADIGAGSPSQIVALSDLFDRLSEAHPKAMKALDLWAFGGWTQEEVASIMELPLRTVEQLISLAKRLVMKAVRDE